MNQVYPVLFALFAVAAFTSCNPRDDDDDFGGPTEFTYNDTTYDVPNGYLISFGDNGSGIYDLDVYLTSESITPGGPFGITGIGDYTYLDLNVSNEDRPLAGNYNWSATRQDFSLVVGTLALDYNLGTFEGNALDARDGTVNIRIRANNTTITFNLTLSDGSTVTGEWSGVLENV